MQLWEAQLAVAEGAAASSEGETQDIVNDMLLQSWTKDVAAHFVGIFANTAGRTKTETVELGPVTLFAVASADTMTDCHTIK